MAKKELEDELMAKISSTEVADELAAVKFELKRLHGIIFKDTTITNRGVAGGSAGSARADPKFWLNSTVLHCMCRP